MTSQTMKQITYLTMIYLPASCEFYLIPYSTTL